MEFNWRGAIDRNWETLCSIAARLTLMARSQAGLAADTLPRQLYLRILALLRPAEFAARRLIAMAACKLPIDIGPVRPGGAPRPSSPLRGSVGRVETSGSTPTDLPREAQLSGSANRVRGKAAPSLPDQPTAPHQLRLVRSAHKPSYPLPEGARATSRIPAFALFDPFKPLGEPWLTEAEIAALDNPSAGPFIPVSRPNEPVDARALRRRIRALSDALENLDAQALRLARWRARRAAGFGRPIRLTPFRPGFPPGWKKRPKTEIEEVLKECNYLGLEAWDTT
jgi:hypothetical protein